MNLEKVEMSPHMELRDNNGQLLGLVPYRQYVLNLTQQFAVIGIDSEKMGGVKEIQDVPGIEYRFLGKLEDQNIIFQSQIINSLNLDDWDFDSYPNPEILLMSIKQL